jgi:hypothetical protein
MPGNDASTSGARSFSVRTASGVYGPANLPVIVTWAQEGRVPPDAMLEPTDGAAAVPVSSVPELARIVSAPPTRNTGLVETDTPTSGIETLIPTRNSAALIGYYLGVFSLIPFLGLPLGLIAIVLGIVGFRAARRKPKIKGTAHAIVAIVLGSLSILIWGGIIIGAIVADMR